MGNPKRKSRRIGSRSPSSKALDDLSADELREYFETTMQEKDEQYADLQQQLQEFHGRKGGKSDAEDPDWEGDAFDSEEQIGSNVKGSTDFLAVATTFKKGGVWKDYKWSSVKYEDKIALAVLDGMNKKNFILTGDRKTDKGKFLCFDWVRGGCKMAYYTSPIWNLFSCFM